MLLAFTASAQYTPDILGKNYVQRTFHMGEDEEGEGEACGAAETVSQSDRAAGGRETWGAVRCGSAGTPETLRPACEREH